MNSVALTGRLTKDADIRYGGQDNQTAIARFTLAVDDRGETDYISCKALGKLGEWVEKWTRKGTKVELTGKVKTGHYKDKDNREVYYTEILASSVGFGESKREAEQRGSGAQPEPAESDGFMQIPDGYEDGLPFN